MNVKIFIQLIIFLIIIIFLFFFIKNTFFQKETIINLDSENLNNAEEFNKTEETNNIIENLNYKSIDNNGNEYSLNAKSGKTSEEDKNILILNEVSGTIKRKNKPDIEIYADFAKYNSKNFNTFFYQNVFGLFKENKISSGNLDLLFNEDLVIMYNNISYINPDLKGMADEIRLNLKNGDIIVKMFDNQKKIRINKN